MRAQLPFGKALRGRLEIVHPCTSARAIDRFLYQRAATSVS